MPYEANMLDLDPTAKDQHGRPRIGSFQLGENEERMGAFLRQKLEAWLKEAGATETWGREEVTPIAVNSHAYGGTRMGSDPAESVVNRWGRVHGCRTCSCSAARRSEHDLEEPDADDHGARPGGRRPPRPQLGSDNQLKRCAGRPAPARSATLSR